jgi:hypothetical protein
MFLIFFLLYKKKLYITCIHINYFLIFSCDILKSRSLEHINIQVIIIAVSDFTWATELVIFKGKTVVIWAFPSMLQKQQFICIYKILDIEKKIKKSLSYMSFYRLFKKFPIYLYIHNSSLNFFFPSISSLILLLHDIKHNNLFRITFHIVLGVLKNILPA